MRNETRAALTSLAVFGLQAVIALGMTRFLVGRLGVVEYGMVPLVNSFVPFLTLAASSIGTATGRELGIALRTQEKGRAREVFSTAVVLSVTAGVAISVLAIVFGPWVLRLLDVPIRLLDSATVLLAGAGIAAGLSVVRSPMLAVAFAENRLDLDNAVVFSDVLIRSVAIVSLFAFAGPSLDWVAVSLVAGALAALVLAGGVWRRLQPRLSVSVSAVRGASVRVLSHIGGWFVIGQLGALLFWSTDLFVLSAMTTAATVGLYGTVAVWPVFLRGLAGAGTSFLNPVLVRQYGSGDNTAVLETSVRAVRLVGLAVAIPVGLVAGFSAPILHVWLGPSFVKLAPVLMALVLPLGLNLSVLPLFGVNVSYGKLALPGVMTLLAGAVNIALSVWWAERWPYGLGVALGTAVALTLKNALFTPAYAAHMQGAPRTRYVRAMVPGIVSSAIVFALSLAVSQLAFVRTLPGLAIVGVAVAFIVSAATWSLALRAEERTLLLSSLRGSQPVPADGELEWKA